MRKIIHIDMDCFFAAIEMRDNPKLRNLPIAVGGTSEQRGVLCTANYVARKYGVRSAMSSAQALKLCPQLVLIRPNSKKYKEASAHMREVFQRYTEYIEPISLDEAFLEVSQSLHFSGSAQLLAKEIKRVIHREIGVTASAGVSCNKFLAKIASDWNKPDGLFVIPPARISHFIVKLPVQKIPGVGRVTVKKLNNLGIFSCGDLQQVPLSMLNLQFGKFGKVLYDRCRGMDQRELTLSRIRKSLSIERTFSQDKNLAELLQELPKLESEFTFRLNQSQQKRKLKIKQLFIKLKFSNFKITTHEEKKADEFLLPLNEQGMIDQKIRNYFEASIKKAFYKEEHLVRLMGIGVRFYANDTDKVGQLDLFRDYLS